MARIFPRNISQQPSGKLIIEEYHPGFNQVFFVPPSEKLEEAGLNQSKPEQYKKLIIEINSQNDFVSIYPINTLGTHDDFLKPKYEKIETITLVGFDFGNVETDDEIMEVLEELPSAFIKDYDYGLGLQKDYRFLIDALEGFGMKHLVISKTENASIDKKNSICTIKHSEFETIRKHIDRITRESRAVSNKVKAVTANNTLAYFLKDPQYPQKTLDYKDSTLAKLITRTSPSIEATLSKIEQNAAIELVSKNNRAIAKEQPEALIKLHNEIELVTLAQLIEKFEAMLGKKLSESRWQQLFNDNPFILNLAFGYPIIKIQDQAHVGGRAISGAGDKITDFLVKNGISNNAALFEIKTPSTQLLNKTAYRDSVYTPSSDFSGAINQMLDQKAKFQQEIASLKHNSKIHDLESYSVHGVLIIGTMPEDSERKKSFELFRGNSKDISILTFDELLGKLKQLQAFLASSDKEAV
jgi:hypothetical protein